MTDLPPINNIYCLENIIRYCDGKTISVFRSMNVQLKKTVEYLEKNENLWKTCCLRHIPTGELEDVIDKVCPLIMCMDNVPNSVWKDIYKTWYAWTNFKKWNYHFVEYRANFTSAIMNIQTSGTYSMFVMTRAGLDYINLNTMEYYPFLCVAEGKAFFLNADKYPSNNLRDYRTESQDDQFAHTSIELLARHGGIHLINLRTVDLHRQFRRGGGIYRKYSNRNLSLCDLTPPDEFLIYAAAFAEKGGFISYAPACIRKDPSSFPGGVKQLQLTDRMLPSEMIYLYVWRNQAAIRCLQTSIEVNFKGRKQSYRFIDNYVKEEVTCVFLYNKVLFLGCLHGKVLAFKLNEMKDLLSLKLCDKPDKVIYTPEYCITSLCVIENKLPSLPTLIISGTCKIYFCQFRFSEGNEYEWDPRRLKTV